MTIFDAFSRLFGSKTEETPAEFPDTEPSPHVDYVHVDPSSNAASLHVEYPPSPAAAWPFPSASSISAVRPYTTTQVTTVTSADVAQIRREEGEIARAQYVRLAQIRREEKEELKNVVMDAPNHGIEFVHVGTTTFAWRYHSSGDGYARNKRVIDVSSAVCNPQDNYARWHGSAIAAQNMLDGKYLTIRIGEDLESPREAVRLMGLSTLSLEEADYLCIELRNEGSHRAAVRARSENNAKKDSQQ